MIESRIHSRKQKLGNQRTPVQERSRQRRDAILTVTAQMLDKVGFDDLTTTLIAKEMGVSVGALYHYFPHKQAILHAIGERWLEEYTATLDELTALDLEKMSVSEFSQQAIDAHLRIYQEQKGMMPLVQAMWAVPELREMDDAHDLFAIGRMAELFQRLGIEGSRAERERLGKMWVEITHVGLLTIIEQTEGMAKRTRDDLAVMFATMLATHGKSG